MKEKLREHIEIVFSEAPATEETLGIKDEIYRNLCDRYDDLIAEGKSQTAAYGLAISGLGDVSEIVDGLRGKAIPETEENAEIPRNYRVVSDADREKIERYRVRSGILGSVAIALYILCWVPLVALALLAPDSAAAETVGITVMMLMIAAATSLIILKGAFKPACMTDEDGDESPEKRAAGDKKERKNPVLRIITGIIWGATLPLYLAVSFISGAWNITWIIFIIAVAVDNLTEAIFELLGKKNSDGSES